MTNTTKIASLALATMIGFAALGGAQAAPFAATGKAPAVETGIDQVRDGGGGGRHHGGRHRGGRDRHHGHRPHQRHGWHDHRWYPRGCYWKTVKVYDPFYDEFFFKKRRFCR